jgi:Spy/CpxP family protein refolding chaperone
MRSWLGYFVVLASVAAPAALLAQAPPDDLSRDALRRQIEDRFSARVQEELGLTNDQAAKMRVTAATYFAKRRSLEQDERRFRQALAGQLRPGVAADQDSVSKLLEGMLQVRERYLQTFRDELKDMSGYLSPVQRAQYYMLRERLLERVRQVRDQNMMRRRTPAAPDSEDPGWP